MSGILLAEHSPPTACRRVVSGTISLTSQGFFSPFPHVTGSLSVAIEYLPLPDGPGGFKQRCSVRALRLPRHPIYSDGGNECSHSLGFPIRKSPDHSLLAASRSLSQLITSFFA